jgi:hypothetical protein
MLGLTTERVTVLPRASSGRLLREHGEIMVVRRSPDPIGPGARLDRYILGQGGQCSY